MLACCKRHANLKMMKTHFPELTRYMCCACDSDSLAGGERDGFVAQDIAYRRLVDVENRLCNEQFDDMKSLLVPLQVIVRLALRVDVLVQTRDESEVHCFALARSTWCKVLLILLILRSSNCRDDAGILRNNSRSSDEETT